MNRREAEKVVSLSTIPLVASYLAFIPQSKYLSIVSTQHCPQMYLYPHHVYMVSGVAYYSFLWPCDLPMRAQHTLVAVWRCGPVEGDLASCIACDVRH